MANGFDRRGALVGAAIFLLAALLVAAVAFPLQTVSFKVDLPPAKAAPQ